MNGNKEGLKLQAIIIGAGTAIPAINHSPASVFLQSTDFSALLDVGPGTFSKLPIYGIDTLLLKYIFVSHLHPDHTLDLVTYFMIHNYAYEKTSNPPLNLIGCIGLEQFLSQIMKQFPDISFPINSMNIREVANDKFNLGDVRVCTTLSDHTERSISFRFDFNDKSLVYTSDCVYSARLEKLCNKADILISECSFPDEWPTNDHMNAQKLGVMAENAQVKKLFVTHRYPPASDVNLEAQIKKYYSGPIRIAQDGDYIKLK